MKNYSVIEDNGGGLHLFVFDGEQCVWAATGYEYRTGALRDDIAALLDGDDPTTDWDGGDDNPQALWDEMSSQRYVGNQLVADENGVYPDRMGNAARREFGIDHD